MIPVGEKFFRKSGRKVQIFPLKVFCPTVPKHFVEEPFSVSIISVIENFMPKRGISQLSMKRFSSHSAKKFCSGTS